MKLNYKWERFTFWMAKRSKYFTGEMAARAVGARLTLPSVQEGLKPRLVKKQVLNKYISENI